MALLGLADALQMTVGECDVMHWTDSPAAIVTVTDDGGSSGRLRRDLGVLPPMWTRWPSEVLGLGGRVDSAIRASRL